MTKQKNTLSEVGIALYFLDTIEKYEKEFHKNPNSFKIRHTSNNEVFEVESNDIIKEEIQKFFNKRKKVNQDIIDDNPELIKVIENMH